MRNHNHNVPVVNNNVNTQAFVDGHASDHCVATIDSIVEIAVDIHSSGRDNPVWSHLDSLRLSTWDCCSSTGSWPTWIGQIDRYCLGHFVGPNTQCNSRFPHAVRRWRPTETDGHHKWDKPHREVDALACAY